jgi:hypothetical protein
MFNEGNQMHNFMSSSGSGTVINYGSGSGSDFLTSYGSLVQKLRFLRFRFRFHNTAFKNIVSQNTSLYFLHNRGRIRRKTWCIGPHVGVDYITSPYVHSRVDSNIYHLQPYARVDFIAQSGT